MKTITLEQYETMVKEVMLNGVQSDRFGKTTICIVDNPWRSFVNTINSETYHNREIHDIIVQSTKGEVDLEFEKGKLASSDDKSVFNIPEDNTIFVNILHEGSYDKKNVKEFLTDALLNKKIEDKYYPKDSILILSTNNKNIPEEWEQHCDIYTVAE